MKKRTTKDIRLISDPILDRRFKLDILTTIHEDLDDFYRAVERLGKKYTGKSKIDPFLLINYILEAYTNVIETTKEVAYHEKTKHLMENVVKTLTTKTNETDTNNK